MVPGIWTGDTTGVLLERRRDLTRREDIPALPLRERCGQEVIDDEQVDAGQLVQELEVRVFTLVN